VYRRLEFPHAPGGRVLTVPITSDQADVR
jgi:hypothetical protein